MPVSIHTTPAFEAKLESYPPLVQPYMLALRDLIHQTAREISEIEVLEESLKWGEPSFKTSVGSTLRMDWKAKNPEQYALYFQCSSRLVKVFRSIFGHTFQYEGNRALLFTLKAELPLKALQQCIRACLIYHKVKAFPTLGI